MRLIIIYGLTVVSWLLRLVPFRVSALLGAVIGFFLFSVFRFRRALVLDNLSRAFGSELNASEVRHLAAANYRHYGRLVIEFLVSLTWGPKQYRKHIRMEGFQHADDLLQRGQGFYFLTLHLGSWEQSLGAASAYGLPIHAVVKRAKSPLAEEILSWCRSRTGARVLVESGSHHEILKAVSSGKAVAFLSDQFMGPPIGLPVKFFGQQAGTAVSLALLLERSEAPVLLAYTFRDSAGRSRIRIEPPFVFSDLSENRHTRLYQRTQQLNDTMERVIRSYPEQWLWLHRRWKTYRGEPRWKPAGSFAAILMCLSVLWGCATTGPEQTGIVLPPDPIIALPKIKSALDAPESVAHAQAMGIIEGVKPPRVGRKEKKKKVVASVVVAPTSAPQAYAMIEYPKLPFEAGERMEIDLNWMALPAGRVILEVRKAEPINGRESLQLWGNVLSSRLVDTIYHVDNTVESFIDAKGAVPYKFLLHMVETSQRKETRVAFDHLNSKAFYWSKRVSQKWGDETVDTSDGLVPGSKDMYSGIYFLRMLDYELNKPVRFRVYEKSKNMEVVVTPVANELVTTKVGVFQCWKLAIQIALNNNLQQTGESFLWVSDDSKRYLVKFDAKVKIGSLKGVLVEVKER